MDGSFSVVSFLSPRHASVRREPSSLRKSRDPAPKQRSTYQTSPLPTLYVPLRDYTRKRISRGELFSSPPMDHLPTRNVISLCFLFFHLVVACDISLVVVDDFPPSTTPPPGPLQIAEKISFLVSPSSSCSYDQILILFSPLL